MPSALPHADVIYLVAGMTKLPDCERDSSTYAINVDAQVAIAAHHEQAHIVYLSSDAAEWPNQTAYGAQKRACELGLLAVCGYHRLAVVRPKGPFRGTAGVDSLCRLLERIGKEKQKGVFRWEAGLEELAQARLQAVR
jgi:nucleoside-diphosphate-sugar epimerase